MHPGLYLSNELNDLHVDVEGSLARHDDLRALGEQTYHDAVQTTCGSHVRLAFNTHHIHPALRYGGVMGDCVV